MSNTCGNGQRKVEVHLQHPRSCFAQSEIVTVNGRQAAVALSHGDYGKSCPDPRCLTMMSKNQCELASLYPNISKRGTASRSTRCIIRFRCPTKSASNGVNPRGPEKLARSRPLKYMVSTQLHTRTLLRRCSSTLDLIDSFCIFSMSSFDSHSVILKAEAERVGEPSIQRKQGPSILY